MGLSKWLLILGCVGVLVRALAVVAIALRRQRGQGAPLQDLVVPWGRAGRWAFLAAALALAGDAIEIVPLGQSGLRVSQLGSRPVVLSPGVHLVLPLVHRVVLYDTRDQLVSTTATGPKGAPLTAQSKEGLGVGLVVDVRYRLDVARLPDMFTRLSGPAEERVALAVASAAREVLPNYLVRETFATKRDEIRRLTAAGLAKRLSSDAIIVVDVALRDVVLPPEYAKGMEGLLLKEQENERMVFDLQIKEKEVKAAELVAEAEKAREVKRAEAAAAKLVLQAKAEADAMQHTLPLKEKQIQQSRLEAEARKETTLKNAEAAAQAKVIDSRAEVERQKLLADAEATRIRVTSAADAERLQREAAVLQDNPLIIQKIVAERLSDKMQIMMVPMDGNGFFANDVFRALNPVRQRQAQETPATSGNADVKPATPARSARR